MGAGSRHEELRSGTNPLFNDRKLKLGTFCTNLDYGAAITTIEGTLRISWPATLALAKLADEMEFEALASPTSTAPASNASRGRPASAP